MMTVNPNLVVTLLPTVYSNDLKGLLFRGTVMVIITSPYKQHFSLFLNLEA